MNFELVTESNIEYLRQESTPFDFENSPCDADDLANGIYDYVKTEEAFGVSGVQLSFPYRVFGVYIESNKFAVMFNPKLLLANEANKVNETEGCLSFPNLFLNINRPKDVCVNYQDTTGKLNTIELKDYYARGFLHELDHLNGVVFIDYVGKLALKMARKKVHKNNKRKRKWQHIQDTEQTSKLN